MKRYSFFSAFVICATLLSAEGMKPFSVNPIFRRDGRDSVRTCIQTLSVVLENFRRDCGRYPTTIEGLEALLRAPESLRDKWRGPYYVGGYITLDAWGRRYCYVCPGTKNPEGFDLFSLGPDGPVGNGVIGNWATAETGKK
jgi:type II secretion system protein G